MERPADAPGRCTGCGHAWGIGRFCTNCGLPRATAERLAVDPPPLAHQAPKPARYPLFADDAAPATARSATYAEDAPAPASAPATAPGPTYDEVSAAPVDVTRRRPAWVGRAVGAAALVAVVAGAAVGGTALLADDSPDSPDAAVERVDAAPSGPSEVPTIDVPTSDAAPSPGADRGDRSGGQAGGGDGPAEDPPGRPLELASLAQATPPATAAPSRDVAGQVVRYDAAQMLDGRPDTAWRMPGDASGQEVVVRLDAPTTITGVGILNGYTKRDPGYDGYLANRRITAVEWAFGDGTVVRHDLAQVRSLQTLVIEDVVTDTVTVRILDVTGPAQGPAGRDYTAISEIALRGIVS